MENVQKILGVAADLFKQYGFKTITMDDIARRTGISKKTLYQHFDTKNEIVIAAMQWQQEVINKASDEITNSSDNAVEAMVRIVGMIENIFRQVNPVAFLELQRFFPEAHDIFRRQQLQRDIQSVADNIRRGMAEGFYREGLNADILARYRLESCLIMLQPSLLGDASYNPELVNVEVFENFLYGLLTAKGERLYQKYKEKYLNRVLSL